MKIRKWLKKTVIEIIVEILLIFLFFFDPIHEFYMSLRGFKWDKFGGGWVSKKDGTPKR